MNRDDSSYDKASRKYDEYMEIMDSKPAPPPRGLPPQRPYVPAAHDDEGGLTVPALIGLGLAGLLFVLAVLAFYTASQWSSLDREGAAIGYTVVGFFLLLASIGGGLATYNHNFRVLAGKTSHHH